MSLRAPLLLDTRARDAGAALHPLHPDALLAALLFAAAVVTRFYGLGRWDIVLDEIFTVNEAADRVDSIVNPVYYWLVVFTQQFVSQPELAVRLPNAVLGTLAIPVFFLTWRTLCGRYAAAVGAVLILLAEWSLWHAQYARYFQGTFLFGSLAYYWYVRALLTGSWQRMALSFVAAAIATGFHISAVTILFGCGAISAVLSFWRVESIGERGRKLARLYLGACLLAGIAAAPVLLSIIGSRSPAELSWAKGPLRNLLSVVDNAEISIVFAAMAGWLLMTVTNRLLAVYFAVSVGTALGAMLAVASIAAVRADYVYHIMPLTYLLAGWFAARVRDGLEAPRALKHSLSVLLVATILPGTASHYLGRLTLHARDPAAFIEANYEAGDRILAFDAGIRFYLDPRLETEPYAGNPYEDAYVVDRLEEYLCSDRQTWIAFRTRRESYVPEVERWLLEHAVLLWRDRAIRFDLHSRGFEVFRVPRHAGCE